MSDTTPPAGELVATHDFRCAVCGASAAVVELFLSGAQGTIVRSSFTSRLEAPLDQASFTRVEKAVTSGDAAALYRCDREFAQFYCPDCGQAYCGQHWARWDVFDDDGWHDSIRGRCPAGHERMLED